MSEKVTERERVGCVDCGDKGRPGQADPAQIGTPRGYVCGPCYRKAPRLEGGLNGGESEAKPRIAAAPVAGEDGHGYGVGIAEEGVAGYQPTVIRCATFEEAVDAARALNEQSGVSDKEAVRIILSSMRAQNVGTVTHLRRR